MDPCSRRAFQSSVSPRSLKPATAFPSFRGHGNLIDSHCSHGPFPPAQANKLSHPAASEVDSVCDLHGSTKAGVVDTWNLCFGCFMAPPTAQSVEGGPG